MKIQCLLFTLALLAGCSSPNEAGNTPTPDATATNTSPPAVPPAAPVSASTTTEVAAPMSTMPDATKSSSTTPDAVPPASATGVVKAVNPVAKTITLDHGPVAALHWPAMIMTFKTDNVDVGSIKPGDHVAFEFTSNGMDATLTKIDRQ
jgi:Cu(I)/Ag(I) efflux system protein CusF